MILSACIPEPENPTIQLSETSQLAQVRDWFEANKTKLRLPDRGTNYRTESQELILPFFEKEPDWEQFHHYYFPDGREVFEVSLENENLYIPKAKDAGASEEDVDYFQNILFVKHPTLPKFDPLIIRYYPDDNSSNRDFEAISYQMIDEKWSGWIDLFTYDEHYLMGYKVTEGELTHTREMQKNPENARKIAVSSENKSDEAIHCYPVATDWYDGRTGEYLDTTWAQTCEWQRGGSRSGGGRGDGGYEEEKPRGGADSPGGGCKKCYDPPEVPEPKPIKKLNCNELWNTHNQEAKTMMEFRSRYYGRSYEEIIYERGDLSITGLGSQPAGPVIDFRYIKDPLNPSLIIDMRHFLVIGKFGRAIGESVEFLQYLAQYESAFDDQDYYSNELGYSFFKKYGNAVRTNPTATADFIVSFLSDPELRNSISSPDKCDKKDFGL
ncbi:hypothetical protein [Algoriphagus marincola]|uniref:hypothetical protein n=1 Tax=Algoriphagus marincola TaxID=264027 RepID=UPI0003F7701B|nr:hypothetical protein [Algoriphagus marincola]